MRWSLSGICGVVSLLAFLLMEGTACQPADLGFRVSVVDGVEVVENSGPGAWADHPPVLKLVLDQVYGAELSPLDAILGSAMQTHVVGTADGELYVADRQMGRLTRFRKDGSVAWTAGSPGKGPGEIYMPLGMAMTEDGESFVIANNRGIRVEFWSSEGEYLRGLQFGQIAGLVGLLESKVVLSSATFIPGIEERVFVIQEEPREISSFDVSPSPEVPDSWGWAGFADVRIYGGNVVAGSCTSYHLRFYTPDGQLVRQVRRLVPYPIRAGYLRRGNSGVRHDFGMVSAPIALPHGFFMVLASWEDGITDPDKTAADRGLEVTRDASAWKAAIDIFDAEGRFMQSIDLPGPLIRGFSSAYPEALGSLTHTAGTLTGQQPYLYTRSDDPFPQIRRYKIEFEPPRVEAGEGDPGGAP
jgi:hypothetical protein